MARNLDLMFLGEHWHTQELPKEKRWLLKYFDTPLQVAFLKYVLMVGNYDNFLDHTGHRARKHWLVILDNRLKRFQNMHKEAKTNMDMTTLALIESGEYPL